MIPQSSFAQTPIFVITSLNVQPMMTGKYETIDEYIALFPKEVQTKLNQLRATISKAAPKAVEAIKYGIPTFVLNGNLVHFGGYKTHIGFYPGPRSDVEFKKELAAFKGGKGTVQFPLDKPIPFALVAKIVKYRVSMNEEKAMAKRKK